jgi:sarcosine oxidase subunit delta
MRIDCSFCGERDFSEFRFKSEVLDPWQASGVASDEIADAIHLRDNIAGHQRELWQHVYGCRSWMVVERDTRTNIVSSVAPVRTKK